MALSVAGLSMCTVELRTFCHTAMITKGYALTSRPNGKAVSEAIAASELFAKTATTSQQAVSRRSIVVYGVKSGTVADARSVGHRAKAQCGGTDQLDDVAVAAPIRDLRQRRQ